MFSKHTISIHAPAKGATHRADNLVVVRKFQSTLPRRERLATETLTANKADFNPRSREGSDLTTPVLISREQKFQSTLPRRERLHLHTQYLQCYKFQSTLPRRERPETVHRAGGIIRISIHAPAKGATRPGEDIGIGTRNFNPRSREGSDKENE